MTYEASNPGKDPAAVDVAIVGGGPCGLVLAHELGRRGVRVVLFNDRPDTTPYPQAGATQARTMEHYRRLGLAGEIRAAGLPADYPTDVAYFTRFDATELARFELPSSRDAATLIRTMSGSWSAAELPHRCSQMYIERILRENAEALPSVRLAFGWKVTGFSDDGERVTVDAVSAGGSDNARPRRIWSPLMGHAAKPAERSISPTRESGPATGPSCRGRCTRHISVQPRSTT